jgi:hypothetical protein
MSRSLDESIPGHLDDLARIQTLKKVFVVGCAKSGTTWVTNLLHGHPRAVVRGEGGFGSRLVPAVLQALRAYNAHQERNGLDFTVLAGGDQLVASRLLVDARLLHYVRASGKPFGDLLVVGDKTPQHTIALDLLAQLYPAARFVHVIRDPRDVATSAWFDFGRRSGQTLDAYARDFMTNVWPANVQPASESGKRLGDRYLEVRYEDLLVDPEPRVRAMLEHVGLPATDDDVRSCVDAGRFETHSGGRRRGDTDLEHFYRAGVAGDWVNHLPPDLVAACTAEIAPLMSAFGYDPAAMPSPAAS